MKKIIVLLAVLFMILSKYSFSQNTDSTSVQKVSDKSSPKIDSTKKEFYLKGAVTITNKGISYIPNFLLGKPACIFDLSLGNKKLSFEPQLRFALNGEPWAFLFSARYKIKSTGKFQMSVGVNPLLNFKNVTYTVSGVQYTELVNRRYLGGEFKPTYFITKNISAGVHYLYFAGVSDRTVKNTNFIGVNANFSNIKLVWGLFTRINAQLYYLSQDDFGGYYFNPSLTLSKKNFPLSVQTIMNTIIDTDIPGSEKFIWNVSLIYSFNKIYIRK